MGTAPAIQPPSACMRLWDILDLNPNRWRQGQVLARGRVLACCVLMWQRQGQAALVSLLLGASRLLGHPALLHSDPASIRGCVSCSHGRLGPQRGKQQGRGGWDSRWGNKSSQDLGSRTHFERGQEPRGWRQRNRAAFPASWPESLGWGLPQIQPWPLLSGSPALISAQECEDHEVHFPSAVPNIL